MKKGFLNVISKNKIQMQRKKFKKSEISRILNHHWSFKEFDEDMMKSFQQGAKIKKYNEYCSHHHNPMSEDSDHDDLCSSRREIINYYTSSKRTSPAKHTPIESMTGQILNKLKKGVSVA